MLRLNLAGNLLCLALERLGIGPDESDGQKECCE
jgi:hypothetical protein